MNTSISSSIKSRFSSISSAHMAGLSQATRVKSL